jgi:ubiquinone/menaquinone biosynthesis C-methylase UbiE
VIDISMEALSLYKKVNKDACELIHGSLFDIPRENESFDGIYNLGVLEHFSDEEIRKTLDEFHRVLKPEGKIIIFWPTRYSLSVLALKYTHYIMNNLLKKNIKLHPDEPSLLKSRKQALKVLKSSEFELLEYHYGIKDLFTQANIVGQKV